MHINQAFILAAWYGTRLRPLTLTIPKPLIHIGWKPLLDYHFNHLHKHGFERFFVNSFYLSEQIENYIRQHPLGNQIILSREEGEILGTAGGVMKQINQLDDYFLVVYGDNLTNVDYTAFLDFLEGKDFDVAMVLYHEPNITQKGMAILDDKWYISWFIEKPKPEQVVWDLANAGIYVIKKFVFEQYTPYQGFFDFGFDFFPSLLTDHRKILSYITSDFLLDIGSFENLEKSQRVVGDYFG